jgi:hypothetical protein
MAFAPAMEAAARPQSGGKAVQNKPHVPASALQPRPGALLPTNIDRSILDDPAVVQLKMIRRILLARAADSRTDRPALLETVRRHDEAGFWKVLGFSSEEVAVFDESIAQLRKQVFTRYPSLRGEVRAYLEQRSAATKSCPMCGDADARLLDRAITIHRGKRHSAQVPAAVASRARAGIRLAAYTPATLTPFVARFAGLAMPAEDEWPGEPDSGDVCNWWLFTISLIGCSATGPGWYWLCAYLAYCEFCSGSARDYFCGPRRDNQ